MPKGNPEGARRNTGSGGSSGGRGYSGSASGGARGTSSSSSRSTSSRSSRGTSSRRTAKTIKDINKPMSRASKQLAADATAARNARMANITPKSWSSRPAGAKYWQENVGRVNYPQAKSAYSSPASMKPTTATSGYKKPPKRFQIGM